MLRKKSILMIAMSLLVVLALVLAGCGGGGGGGKDKDDDDGGGFFQATAEDYKGTWRWEDTDKCPYSVEFTVGDLYDTWDRGSYRKGSMTCSILGGTVNIEGDINDYEGYIQLLIEPYQHGIDVRVFREMTDTHNVKVELSGQLTEPGVISVCELMIEENNEGVGVYYYHYVSSEHDDEFLLFTKQ